MNVLGNDALPYGLKLYTNKVRSCIIWPIVAPMTEKHVHDYSFFYYKLYNLIILH